MSSIAVIDYGMGNLHSIAKALQHVSSSSEIWVTSVPEKISRASRVVFPGVGAIRDCMSALNHHKLIDVLREAADQKPFLGICLGLQAMLGHSEEGGHIRCLDIFPGNVVRFQENEQDENGNRLKIPHMGWNQIQHCASHPLWKDIPQRSYFYFVHSYFAAPTNESHIMATSAYPQPFACAVGKENIFAVQFHPEKSQNAGLQLLKNFVAWQGES